MHVTSSYDDLTTYWRGPALSRVGLSLLLAWLGPGYVQSPASFPAAVSYTHLDVYKRQVPASSSVLLPSNPAKTLTYQGSSQHQEPPR